jgi:hypothetical protein
MFRGSPVASKQDFPDSLRIARGRDLIIFQDALFAAIGPDNEVHVIPKIAGG